MDTGSICDKCQEQLDNPPDGGIARKLSLDEREALLKMRQVVSGDYPRALVMKGGGVKGLAFAGALLELERYYWFDRHVGTSAGAIAAALLAGGFAPNELADLLSKKSFREFMDAPFWKLPFNLVFRRGCYPGDHFRAWIGDLLHSKIA
ncbi:MAG TPA: patatin-like phospholipase family protein [Verrucomicrobiae bacterium]|nr:patatin-like phospholipase family protein [Verrucomicrobiae bacterium]